MAIMSSLFLVALSQNTTAVPALDVPVLDELVLLQNVMQVASDSADLVASDSADLLQVPTIEKDILAVLDLNVQAINTQRRLKFKASCLRASAPPIERSVAPYPEIGDAMTNYDFALPHQWKGFLALHFGLAKARGKIDDNADYPEWRQSFNQECSPNDCPGSGILPDPDQC